MSVRLASHVFPSLRRAEVPRRGGVHPATAAFRGRRPAEAVLDSITKGVRWYQRH
jgi:hypothetical protein